MTKINNFKGKIGFPGNNNNFQIESISTSTTLDHTFLVGINTTSVISQVFNILPPDMFLWWKLDENSGTSIADSSFNNITGVFSGSPTWTSDSSNGVQFPLNGSDRITATDGNAGTSNEFIVAMSGGTNIGISFSLIWTPTGIPHNNGPGPGTTGSIIGFGLNSIGSSFAVRRESGSIGGGSLEAGNHGMVLAYATVGSSSIVHAARWNGWVEDTTYHLIIIFDFPNARQKLYVNGILVSSRALVGSLTNTLNFVPVVGPSIDAVSDDCKIEDFIIYTRALSTSDIAVLTSIMDATHGTGIDSDDSSFIEEFETSGGW